MAKSKLKHANSKKEFQQTTARTTNNQGGNST